MLQNLGRFLYNELQQGGVMIPRLISVPETESYFLFGPRGTGKSSFLKLKYPNAFWMDLLDPETYRLYVSKPERLITILSDTAQKEIVIDEVQKIPELLDVVHLLIEKKQGYQFILTGSSSRKLKRYGVNLLAGRALLKYMPPFFASELKDQFNLENSLKWGMLPLVFDSSSPSEVLKAYVGIYLKEEVQAEGIVRNVGDFARFLEVMSFSHAALINASNVSREAQIARKTVDSYLSILYDLLLGFELSIFTRKAKRSLSKGSKFYFFDSGVYFSIRPKNLYDVESESQGAALEGLVAQHLRAWALAQKETYQLHFWRTSSQVEVDFILSGKDLFLAIEVKNGKVVHPKDLTGLLLFKEDYPMCQPLILYRGKEKYIEKGILCLPIETFLASIHPKRTLNIKSFE